MFEGPNGQAATEATHVDEPLINAIVKAMRWREQLTSGQVRSIEQIAGREECDESHIRHLLAFAFLAPDIIERILHGTQPRQVTLNRLVRLELPMKWADQRALLGVGAAQ